MFPPGIPLRKRLFDLALTIPLLVLISPLLLIAAFLVRLFLGQPILFRQLRPGYQGRPFHVYKFRTMTEKKNAQGALLPDEQRLTLFGRFLRSTSIDELPELFQVLTGRMSLVGPRPLLMQYLPLYSSEQMRRHNVLPGITGWAQVNGRNALSWEDKFRLDVWYVDHWSLRLDLKILAMTFMPVVRRAGISQPGHTTSAEFTGSIPASQPPPEDET